MSTHRASSKDPDSKGGAEINYRVPSTSCHQVQAVFEIRTARIVMGIVVVIADIKSRWTPGLASGIHQITRVIACVAGRCVMRGTGRDKSQAVNNIVKHRKFEIA